jgi:hypothetical protein
VLPAPRRPPSAAESRFMRLAHQIARFEESLHDDEEIGARLVSAPNNSVFHVTNLEYRNPDLIIFHGTNEHNKPLQLIQHVTQLNVLLTALPKESETPRRIGFILLDEINKSTSS